jgi:hypothetical protein
MSVKISHAKERKHIEGVKEGSTEENVWRNFIILIFHIILLESLNQG